MVIKYIELYKTYIFVNFEFFAFNVKHSKVLFIKCIYFKVKHSDIKTVLR